MRHCRLQYSCSLSQPAPYTLNYQKLLSEHLHTHLYSAADSGLLWLAPPLEVLDCPPRAGAQWYSPAPWTWFTPGHTQCVFQNTALLCVTKVIGLIQDLSLSLSKILKAEAASSECERGFLPSTGLPVCPLSPVCEQEHVNELKWYHEIIIQYLWRPFFKRLWLRVEHSWSSMWKCTQMKCWNPFLSLVYNYVNINSKLFTQNVSIFTWPTKYARACAHTLVCY